VCVGGGEVGDAFPYFLTVSEARRENNLYTPINDYVEKQQVVSCN
jgi:hypothetical protein